MSLASRLSILIVAKELLELRELSARTFGSGLSVVAEVKGSAIAGVNIPTSAGVTKIAHSIG